MQEGINMVDSIAEIGQLMDWLTLIDVRKKGDRSVEKWKRVFGPKTAWED